MNSPRLMPERRARRTSLVATAAMVAVIAAWKGPAAFAAGGPALAVVALVALPLVVIAAGIRAGRVRVGRASTLVLPFYAAGFLTEAVANPDSRGWAALGAFATALAFASTIAWVRRA